MLSLVIIIYMSFKYYLYVEFSYYLKPMFTSRDLCLSMAIYNCVDNNNL